MKTGILRLILAAIAIVTFFFVDGPAIIEKWSPKPPSAAEKRFQPAEQKKIEPALLVKSDPTEMPSEPPPAPRPGGSELAEADATAEMASPGLVTIPVGTVLQVRLLRRISTNESRPGDDFHAIVEHDIYVDEAIVIAKGCAVRGSVIESEKPGRVRGEAVLTLQLLQIFKQTGQMIPIQTELLTFRGDRSRGKDIGKVAVATGLGALIGGVANGRRGTERGTAFGLGAGATAVLATRGKAVEIPREATLSFQLADSALVPPGMRP